MYDVVITKSGEPHSTVGLYVTKSSMEYLDQVLKELNATHVVSKSLLLGCCIEAFMRNHRFRRGKRGAFRFQNRDGIEDQIPPPPRGNSTITSAYLTDRVRGVLDRWVEKGWTRRELIHWMLMVTKDYGDFEIDEETINKRKRRELSQEDKEFIDELERENDLAVWDESSDSDWG